MNITQYFLNATKESSYLTELINEIKKNNSFYFKKIDSLNYSFSSSFNNFQSVSEASHYSESKITLVYYDTSMGYIRKRVYDCGYLIENKSAIFSLDLEANIYDKHQSNNQSFESCLEEHIDNYGKDESEIPKIGDFVCINCQTCTDEDVLNWIDSKDENKFKVTHIEVATDGVWIENCDYRIDIYDCMVV